MAKSQRLGRLGAATIAAGAPIIGLGVVGLASPAGATWIGPTYGSGNNTVVEEYDQAAEPASQDALCGVGKNDNSYSFSAHLEFVNNGALVANTGDFTLGSDAESRSYCYTGINFGDSQSVTLWKDSGSSHIEMSTVSHS